MTVHIEAIDLIEHVKGWSTYRFTLSNGTEQRTLLVEERDRHKAEDILRSAYEKGVFTFDSLDAA